MPARICSALGSSLQAPGRPPKFVGPWVDKDADDAGLTYSMQPRIVEHLRAEIGRVYGTDAVRVENSVRVVGGDVCAGELVAEASDGSRRSSTFDLVVGADGVSSLVRALVADTVRWVPRMLCAVCTPNMWGVSCCVMLDMCHVLCAMCCVLSSVAAACPLWCYAWG